LEHISSHTPCAPARLAGVPAEDFLKKFEARGCERGLRQGETVTAVALRRLPEVGSPAISVQAFARFLPSTEAVAPDERFGRIVIAALPTASAPALSAQAFLLAVPLA